MAIIRKNCWEFKQCGRQPNGAKASELGVCSASTDRRATGINGGRNGGRACWAISGTLCGGVVQGSFASKLSNCMMCDFYKLVSQQEGVNLQSPRDILAALK